MYKFAVKRKNHGLIGVAKINDNYAEKPRYETQARRRYNAHRNKKWIH